MPIESIDLLDELKGESHYSSAILGTYTFDGEFFERKILPTIQSLNITNTVVLTDTHDLGFIIRNSLCCLAMSAALPSSGARI